MRRITTRLLAFLFTAALLLELVPSAVLAVETPYFTAVNDMLLDLDDATMPFWSEGTLYVPDTIFSGTTLGVTYTRSRDKMSVALYQVGRALLFDLAADTAVDTNGKKYSRTAIARGDHVFFPISLLLNYFGMEYSYTRITYGYLVRIKTADAALSDAGFIDAANSLFALRYNQYVKANTPENTPGSSTSGSTSGSSADDVPPGETAVYAAFAVTDAASGDRVLTAMQVRNVPITLLFTPESLASCGDLVRRAVTLGCTVGIYIDDDSGAGAVETANTANALLWAHASCKTRIVYAAAGTGTVEDALSQAGYRCFTPHLDYSTRTLSGEQSISALAAATRARGTKCTLYLGADTHFGANAAQIVTTMREKSCTFAKLTELV
ncbi:MAG: hypothetical protein IJF15_02240 [Oscillospiraceae bacterium]|nr:hypothetical protein [Oscillospiraceae bacterium]